MDNDTNQHFDIKEVLTPGQEKQAEEDIKKGAFPVLMTCRSILSADMETLLAWVEVGKSKIIERIDWKLDTLGKIGFFDKNRASALCRACWSAFMSPALEDVDYIRLDVVYDSPVSETFSLLFQSPIHNIFLAFLAQERMFCISTGTVGTVEDGSPLLPVAWAEPQTDPTLAYALSVALGKADQRKRAGVPKPGQDQALNAVGKAIQNAAAEGTSSIAFGYGDGPTELAEGMKLYEEARQKIRAEKKEKGKK